MVGFLAAFLRIASEDRVAYRALAGIAYEEGRVRTQLKGLGDPTGLVVTTSRGIERLGKGLVRMWCYGTFSKGCNDMVTIHKGAKVCPICGGTSLWDEVPK